MLLQISAWVTEEITPIANGRSRAAVMKRIFN